ncbi:Putative N-acetylmannosamine-6-phosphate 2-epimerase [Raoultella terrigena]|uniref:N-acylglucosamine-6-phosphate 2-epimerase n=1 Tax=Raoultella terrigena TaxID=577 RepID=A0A4U9D167_RAOTE|nr:Putative N-acetylmannosamine-6-phosphate 2-epimerase [Raoultella terrigena]
MPVAVLLARIHQHNTLAMTDCSSPEDGLSCQRLGAEIIGTTLSGYTGGETPQEPDLALVRTLHAAGCRVIAEGRYNTPEQAGRRCATARGRLPLARRLPAWSISVNGTTRR